jgi:hypothetical protein
LNLAGIPAIHRHFSSGYVAGRSKQVVIVEIAGGLTGTTSGTNPEENSDESGKHRAVSIRTGRPIETQKSRIGQVIEEKAGMDFDRFTRSILLAQGGFDTFLKADVEQKSRILEQISGLAHRYPAAKVGCPARDAVKSDDPYRIAGSADA